MNDTNILGDVPRKGRFDPTLADRLNTEAEVESRKEAEELLRKKNSVNDYSEDNPDISPRKFRFTINQNYMLLKDISCTDADGNVFEHYDNLWVATDVVRTNTPYSDENPRIRHDILTPSDAIVYSEKDESFLPSLALTCNIMERLYFSAMMADFDIIMDQYVDRGDHIGVHIQNTVIDWNEKNIIHYPNTQDIFKSKNSQFIFNGSRPRTELSFDSSEFHLGKTDYITTLDDPNYLRFIKNLTGLKDPDVLSRIVQHLGSSNKIDLNPFISIYNNYPFTNDMTAVTIGLDAHRSDGSFDFTLDTSSLVTNDYALARDAAIRKVMLYKSPNKRFPNRKKGVR